MAYEAKENRETLNMFEKNKRGDTVKVDKITNLDGGDIRVDIREYFQNDDDETCPTKKGIRLKNEWLLDVALNIISCLNEEDRDKVLDTLQQ